MLNTVSFVSDAKSPAFQQVWLHVLRQCSKSCWRRSVYLYDMSTWVLHKAWFIHILRKKSRIMDRHINTSECGTLSSFSWLFLVYFLTLILKLQCSDKYASHNKHMGCLQSLEILSDDFLSRQPTLCSSIFAKLISSSWFSFHMALTHVETRDLCSCPDQWDKAND